MPTLNIRIYQENQNYPKDLAHIVTSEIKPIYKMFPIDIGNREEIVITLERRSKN